MWQTGYNPTREVRDVNKLFAELEGELAYEDAQATLAEFFYHNPALMLDLLAGIKLFPMQELHIKGWMQSDFSMVVWSRGLSKSWSIAVFVLLWALFNPGNRIVVASFSFRSSRNILDQCYKFVVAKGAELFAGSFPDNKQFGLQRATDVWEWTLPNGSTIKCLPLGDGTRLRGNRADTLVVDEFAFLPESVVGTILQPFLVAQGNVKEQQVLREIEDQKIAAGEMTEAERTVLEDSKKVIFLSSACYQFEHLYKRYEEWTKEIMNNGSDPNHPKSLSSYFVSRLGYQAGPEGLVNVKIIEDAKKNTSEAVFAREYEAIFTPDSGGYFRASKMKECTIPDGEAPTMELRGEAGFEYIVAIDTALSGAEDSDHFAIQVLKIITRQTDGRKIPMLVHSYAVAGGSLKDHILYFFYILTHFNVVYIATDASQGDNVEFLNSAIQSKLFKDAKIELCDLEADFKCDDFKKVPEEVKRSYNRTIGRIIHKQPFSSTWQRAANEYMQASFDHRWMLFAGKIAANSGAAASMMSFDMSMLRAHADFEDMSISQFMELQDHLVDMTKAECAMIVTSQTPTGVQQFGLPQNMKRVSGPSRPRKDSYSALLLGIWAAKVYLESQTIEVRTAPPEFPYRWIG
jgi:hypothetical protein